MPDGWSWNDTLIGTAGGQAISVLAWLTVIGLFMLPPTVALYALKLRRARRRF